MSFGSRHLGPLLPRFHREHPNVSLELSLNDRIVDLVEEGQDVAVRISNQLAGSLVARPLAPVRLVVCAAPAYLERFGVPRTPADLVHHQCLLYSYSEQPTLWRLGGETVTVAGFLRANNGDVLRAAALAGEGIVCQPSFIVGDDLRAGRLVALLPDHPAPSVTVYAVYPSRLHLSAKVRAFVDFLASAWGDPPPWDAWLSERSAANCCE